MLTAPQSMILVAEELRTVVSTLLQEVSIAKVAGVKDAVSKKPLKETWSCRMHEWLMLRFLPATCAMTKHQVYAVSNRPASVVWPAVRITRR